MGLLVDGVWRDDSYDKAPDAGRPLRPADHQIPQLDHARRQPRPLRRGRLPGRGRPLSPLRLARLPVGAPHHHLPQAQAARERDLAVGHLLAHGRARLDLRHRTGLDRRRGATATQLSRNLSAGRLRTTPAASPCRCCGTSSARPSSTTSRPRSSACSTRRSTPSPTNAPTIIRRTLRERDRRAQRPGLSERQQRRLSRRLRTTQDAYEEAFRDVFDALDELERRLSRQRYLAGAAH